MEIARRDEESEEGGPILHPLNSYWMSALCRDKERVP
jgi:hypothetical protein